MTRLLSDPELVESNPRKLESCPICPVFRNHLTVETFLLSACFVGHHCGFGLPVPCRFRDYLTVPDSPVRTT